MGISSIWNNTFYDKPPVPKWCFEVDFESYFLTDETGKAYKIGYSDMLSKAVVSCSWPGRDGNLISTYYAGLESKLPGRPQTAKDLTIKFNENTDLSTTRVLEELYHAEINCDSYFTNQEGFVYNKNFNKIDRKIRLLIHKPDKIMMQNDYHDEESKILAIITFHNCIMYKIDEQEFSYENEDEILTRTATFSFDYMTIKGDRAIINNTCAMNK